MLVVVEWYEDGVVYTSHVLIPEELGFAVKLVEQFFVVDAVSSIEYLTVQAGLTRFDVFASDRRDCDVFGENSQPESPAT